MPAVVQYTCPMHPEIVRDAPGNCPICGMALEAMSPQAEAENPELASMTRRFWVGLVLTLPLLGVMVADLFGHPLAGGWLGWMEFALATSGGAVGRVAVLSAGMGFGGSSQSEYVYADRDWFGCGLSV